ncbi:3-hydroxyacyl-CoA dehydrogenase [Rhodococcus triatomae]|uniref:3-hydroxybutyryl-CoA dehydrogenase n=1 Tax=Rhodococcus triatomae TaxID=300028 RepID=A0A1G8GGD4_9NOCA|nr:3-hydroxyacyl-CoA dehydrogenase [Rhodococcus triatomae]QNG20387.1 3-hydroxyacyl-CoA dehydrogenase [Rhodococcus triatomae]QNG23697.1 3-hydroxyacyl-CoA dehydrogenase [Rhodococcus triatomae]SDH93434.1 3-hydroxybutyryl-CoA dehydrogenase [Rhodococcus triatomae]
MSEWKNVTVLGTGVLGSQIAYQTAYSGFDVVAFDIDATVLDEARQRFTGLARTYVEQVDGAADGKADEALARVSYSSDLAEAVKDADLVIEAIPENFDIKKDTYTRLGEVAPPKTIFATNSSTLLPSSLMEFTGRPEKFLALHFANQVWIHNTAEVMGTEKTDPKVYQEVADFASAIGMVPIEIKKEKAGYLLNSLLVPFLGAAGELVADGIAEPEMIDKTWKIATGAPHGPFEIYDVVGLTTAYNISSAGGPKQQEFARYLKENYIDEGKLGVATGEGFYKYPRDAT